MRVPLDEERLADVCMSAVRMATAPLLARIQALEQRAMVPPRDGRDGAKGEPGKDADIGLIVEMKSEIAALRSALLETKALPDEQVVRAWVQSEVAALPPAKDGKDADVAMIDDLRRDVSELRLAHENYKTSTSLALVDVARRAKESVPALVVAEVERAVAAIPKAQDGAPGQAGESIDPEAVDAMVAAHVSKAFSDLRLPEDGRSVTVEDVAPLIAAEVTKAVEAFPKPKDGIGVVSAIVGRDGHLVQTFTDGSTKDVGHVVGRDADLDVMARMIAEEVAKIPRPKDGRDGTIENIKVVQVDDRTWTLCFKDGTPLEGDVIRLHYPKDEGVWRPDETYVKGDGVSFGGSWFIAQRNDPGKPEVGDGWRLAVKRGRDGRSGKDVSGEKRPVTLPTRGSS